MKKLIIQFIRFSVVGVIAFSIDYGLFALLTQVFGVYYLISSTISFIVSVIFNYIASMRYVFSDARADLSPMTKFVVFVILSAIGLGINQLAMWTGVEFFYLSPLIVKFFATAIVAVWNFVTRKLFYEREPKEKKSISTDLH